MLYNQKASSHLLELAHLDLISLRLPKNLPAGGVRTNNSSSCSVWGLRSVLGILCKGSTEDSWPLNDGESLRTVEEGRPRGWFRRRVTTGDFSEVRTAGDAHDGNHWGK